MSFDLYFLSRGPGQSWDDAMAALGGGDRSWDSSADRRWEAVEAVVRSVLPDVEVFADDASREASHEATGIQVSMFPGELVLSVPYWYEGDEAERVTELLRRLARAIEEATGLTAYDPQSEAPFLDESGASTAALLDTMHGRVQEIAAYPPPPPTAAPRRGFFDRFRRRG